ncbi:Chitin bind 1 domain containing protein [Pyrenophora teres f. maculata]|nr:Chitin bind 1 domain containing protein [Pyrenophora teres f. maculata]
MPSPFSPLPLLSFLLLLPLLTPTVLSTNTIKIVNHCPYPLYYWLVGPANTKENDLSGDAHRNLVPSHGGSIIHQMVDTTHLGGGMTLKMRDLPYYNVQPAGIMQVEYNLELERGALWYDLSAIDCDHGAGPEVAGYCPFMAGGISLKVANVPAGICNGARCSNSKCEGTYTTHESYLDEPSFWCGAGADLIAETCIEGPGKRTFYGKDPNEPISAPASVPESDSYPTPSTTSIVSPLATPDHTYIPAPAPSPLDISIAGECGPISNQTCAGSTHGLCCSDYGYCGSTWAHCSGQCQQTYGFCLRGGENGTQVAEVSPKAGFGDLPKTLESSMVGQAKPMYTTPPDMMKARRVMAHI